MDTQKIFADCTACKAAQTQLQSQATAIQQRAQALGQPLQAEAEAIQKAAGGKAPDAALQTRIRALQTILSGLSAEFPVPIVIVQHRSMVLPNYLADVLGRKTSLAVKFAEHSERMQPGTVYLAPPGLHVETDRHLRLTLRDGRRIRHLLSSANPLFESAAAALDGGVIAVVLTGYGQDGTNGVQAIHARGGTVIACPPCVKSRGYAQDDFIDGVTIAGASVIHERFKAGAASLSF